MACLRGGSVTWDGRPFLKASLDSHEFDSSIFSGGSIGGLSGVPGTAALLGDVECTEPESDMREGTLSRGSPPRGIDGDGSSACPLHECCRR